MFKKALCFTLLVCILPVQLWANAINLNDVFDNLNYELNVNWDQKDSEKYTQIVQNFTRDLARLQAQGLTTSEMKKAIEMSLRQANLVIDLDELLGTIDIDRLDSQNISEIIMEKIEAGRIQGASWNGNAIMYTYAAVVISAFIVGFILIKPNPTPVCYNETVYGPYGSYNQVVCH